MLMKYSEATCVRFEDYISGLPERLGIKRASALVETINSEYVYSVVRGIEGDVFKINYDYWPWQSELLVKNSSGHHTGFVYR